MIFFIVTLICYKMTSFKVIHELFSIMNSDVAKCRLPANFTG